MEAITTNPINIFSGADKHGNGHADWNASGKPAGKGGEGPGGPANGDSALRSAVMAGIGALGQSLWSALGAGGLIAKGNALLGSGAARLGAAAYGTMNLFETGSRVMNGKGEAADIGKTAYDATLFTPYGATVAAGSFIGGGIGHGIGAGMEWVGKKTGWDGIANYGKEVQKGDWNSIRQMSGLVTEAGALGVGAVEDKFRTARLAAARQKSEAALTARLKEGGFASLESYKIGLKTNDPSALKVRGELREEWKKQHPAANQSPITAQAGSVPETKNVAAAKTAAVSAITQSEQQPSKTIAAKPELAVELKARSEQAKTPRAGVTRDMSNA